MPVARVQCSAAGNGNSASGRTQAFTSNVTAGNAIVVCVSTYNSGTLTVTVTDSLGNTYSQAGSYSTNVVNRVSIWYAVNITGGACTVTVTPSASAYMDICVIEYSGVKTSSPVSSTTGTTGTSGTYAPGTLTVATAGSVAIGVAGVTANTNTFCGSGPSGLVAVVSDLNSPILVADSIASANINPTIVSSNQAWAAVGAVLDPTTPSGSGGGVVVAAGMHGGMR